MVISEDEEPTDGNMKEWSRKQRMAFTSIVLNVEDDQLVHLEDLGKDPVKAWQKLATVHQPRSISNKMHLFHQLLHSR